MPRLFLCLLVAAYCSAQETDKSWGIVGGSSGNTHYSSLAQINTQNVKDLRVAWTFESGDSYPDSDMQCNPIVVGETMFVTTPKLRVVALNALTGRQLWSFSSSASDRAPNANRGVTYWTDGKSERVLLTAGHELLSLDARTGKLDPHFGKEGRVDLRAAFDRQPLESNSLTITSPGVIYRNLLILGSTLPETLPADPGDIRAYNVQTGQLAWTFHTIPHPGEFGYETWPPNAWKTSGAANNWAGMVVDAERGSVFVPTGSPAFDFYGSDRHGDNLFSDSLICLDAATGKRKWHFQAVKHDVWDLDFPCPPVLVTAVHEGRPVAAVAEIGKNGYVYVLNRETGESLFPLETRSIAPSQLDGEQLAKEQVLPKLPKPFVRQHFTEQTVTNRTPEAHQAVLEQVKNLNHGDLFIAPSLKGTIYFPGLAGGAEWGGASFDPQSHLLYVNANELPWLVRLVPADQVTRTTSASRLYRARCSGCHGPDRKGAPPEYPALDHLEQKLSAEQISAVLHQGRGRMPAFGALGDTTLQSLTTYLLNQGDPKVTFHPQADTPSPLKYAFEGYRKFLDPDGYPAVTPPWGTLSAINLDTGEYSWQIPFGEYPELVAKGYGVTGTENHGGSVVTAGGLLFIGATHYDNKFRAYDKATGKVLWETVLPHAANATPATYQINGKQYVVVASGGGRERPSGGAFMAFALP